MHNSDIESSKAVEFTVVTSSYPEVVTKQFGIKDGELKKKTSANVSAGQLDVKRVYDLESFAGVIQGLGPNQCLSYGRPPMDSCELITEEKWRALGKPSDKVPRTDSVFSWPSTGGVLMLDYDAPKDGSAPMSSKDLVSLILTVPGMSEAQILWMPSTSSCLYDGDEEVVGVKGQRMYMLLQKADDAPRVLKVINETLWANGHGRFEVSASGALLERPLLDGSTSQPNRIDFAAGAKCYGTLTQRRNIMLINKDKPCILDSVALVPDLKGDMEQEARYNKDSARAFLYDEAKQVRAEWQVARAQAMFDKCSSSGFTLEDAMDTASRAINSRMLMGNWLVSVLMDGNVTEVSVASILDNPRLYHGCKTLDPIEPEYDGVRPVGKLFLFGAQPVLHSMAHGSTTYKLIRQPASIEVIKGKSYDCTESLLRVLRDQPNIFDFGQEMVVIDEGKHRPMGENLAKYVISGICEFYYIKEDADGVPMKMPCDVPTTVLKNVVAMGAMRKLKPLKCVITAPTLRPDGSVISAPGYDHETEMLLDLPNGYVCDVPERPTEEQAVKALKYLWSPFTEFPFASNLDKACFLSALITAAVRPGLPASIGFGLDAPVQGSGKTLLAECVSILATGESVGVWPHVGSNDDEVRKRLFTALRDGTRSIVWDNIVGVFDSAAMASFLTSDMFRDRILGQSEQVGVPNRAVLTLTGNNMVLAGDMSRRILTARIDPKSERPYARQFSLDPKAFCKSNRLIMVEAALVLVRFCLANATSRPAQGRIASFEQWDDWVRQTVVFLNQTVAIGEFGDVIDRIDENQKIDPDQDQLFEVLHAWRACFEDRAVSVSEAIKSCEDATSTCFGSSFSRQDNPYYNLLEVFADITGKVSSKSVSRWLKFRVGRQVDGLCLKEKRFGDRAIKWIVEVTGEGSPDQKLAA